MKNIRLLKLDKYDVLSNYQIEKEGVYKDLKDTDSTNYRISLSFELEDDEDSQYPLEDILDKYYLYVSDSIENSQNPNILNLELAGELDDIIDVMSIIGKRVYNKSFVTDDGQTYVKLLIE